MIPTAEDFINFLEVKGLIFPSEKERLRAKNSFIEFAKLHVEASLKEASEQVYVSDTVFCEIDRNSILNAYPIENIK